MRLISLVLVVLFGCAPAGPHIRKKAATAHVNPSEREAAFGRALQAMQRGGWIVAVSDRSAGILTTQSMNTGVKPCGSLACDSRGTLQITITEVGDVTVNLHRELYAPGGVGWFVPTFERDVKPIEEEQAEVLAAILGPRPAPQQVAQVAQPALFVAPHAPGHVWPDAGRSYRENCERTLTARYGTARTAAQIRYACECITWTWQDRYAIEELYDRGKRDAKAVQDETTSISAECKSSRPVSLGPDRDAARQP